MSPSTSTRPTSAAPTFQSLGVRPMINCWGTYTIISGSRMVPQAAEAMYEATNGYVNMEELMEAVGQRLAELTGAEWGLITCGCAAAIDLITAACIAGADPEKMARLPDSTGMKNECISQKAHRNGYDRSIRLAGGVIIEVETEADLLAAISERTAMITITGDAEERSTIPIARMIEIGHAHGIPCFVDAAAQRLDLPNRYLEMGADAVAYSGGKCLRGPQSSGLVLGNKRLLQAAYLNGSPHGSQGRPMKASKEEIMGLLAAIEAFILGRDHQAEWAMWESYLDTIRGALADLPSIQFEVRQPGIANVTPILAFTWDQAAIPCSPAEARQALLDGDPRIICHQFEEGLGINPYMMEDGDAEIVGPVIHKVLADAKATAKPVAEPPSADVSGAWRIVTHYTYGESQHAMTLSQSGSEVSGTYRSQYQTVPVSGHIEGNHVSLRAVLPFESSRDAYEYEGTIDGDAMRGELHFGAWPAQWEAERIG